MTSICRQYEAFNRPVHLPWPRQIGILDCKLGSSIMLCTLIYKRKSFSCHWGPCSSLLIFDLYRSAGGIRKSFVVDLTAQQHRKRIASSSLDKPLSFSPSGQLVADSQGNSLRPRITCLSSGMELWIGNSIAEEIGDNIMCGPFLPSGCGLVVSGFDPGQQSGMLHILRWS